jgi:hypothetical protein
MKASKGRSSALYFFRQRHLKFPYLLSASNCNQQPAPPLKRAGALKI